MSKTILIGCRLPSGITLDGTGGEKSVTLNGQNTAFIPGAPGLTTLDETEWAYLKAAYAQHSAFLSNAVFAAGDDSVASVLDAAADLKGELTGFEGVDPTKPSDGVEPQDEKQLKAALQTAQTKAAPKKTPAKAADKVAALEAAQLAAAKP